MTDVHVATDADIAEVKRLFGEYAAWVGVDLSFQDFDSELAQLPGDYAPPAGALFVARVDGKVAGCVAAHRWREGVCEMKRLFVGTAFEDPDAAVFWSRVLSPGLAGPGISASSWTRCQSWIRLSVCMRGLDSGKLRHIGPIRFLGPAS